MDKIKDSFINSNLGNQQSDTPWWNRPVVGENSLLEQIATVFSKPEVSESGLFLHNREMMEARVFAKTAEAIDNDKFGSQEFIFYLKIKYLLIKGIDEYEGLYDSVQLLGVAIEAKDCFLTIYQAELAYRGSKQQEFYTFVEELLSKNLDPATFREQVQAKLIELLPQIKTEEGKTALQAYAKQLDHLAEHKLGLKLLSLFKTYQLADYSILRTISEMINTLGNRDLQDFKGLVSLVMVNYNVFEKLRLIIGVSEGRSTPDTYARMIQFISLGYRYQVSFMKFEELMRVVRKWFRLYQAIVGIRQEYPPSEYKQPKDFSAEIPGLAIYEKYKKWLTDKKTGYTYVDFGEEAS